MVKLNGFATSVARFNANSGRANLNCNDNLQNSKSEKDENASLGITYALPPRYYMKTYKNLYKRLCSIENLELAFWKARKKKSKKEYVIEFEENLEKELNKLHYELTTFTYEPRPLKRFIIRDPKTREIHASNFRDRVVYHALVNIIEPIFEKVFIYDSYASRKNKGTHKAVQRLNYFIKKVSKNGRLIKNPHSNNSVIGYAFKADIKHYFETVNHEILLKILRRKIKDNGVIWLVEKIIDNFETTVKGKGMPLGNLTSQFFANVYLNKLDYFVKHKLQARYYIRYVDDFMILHSSKSQLGIWKSQIDEFLKKELKLGLHPEKSRIIPLRNGVPLLGYRNFYHYKLMRESNLRKFEKNFIKNLDLYKENIISIEDLLRDLQGWFGYAIWANTYNLRKNIMGRVEKVQHKSYKYMGWMLLFHCYLFFFHFLM